MGDSEPLAASSQAEKFPLTRWSVILRAAKRGSIGVADPKDEDAAGEALEHLSNNYWRPVYTFVRSRGYCREDAQDLTQAYFARLLERREFLSANPSLGRFRTFLLTTVRHFMSNQQDRVRAQKRGGGVEMISLDADDVGPLLDRVHVEQRTPEAAFEKQWAQTVLKLAAAQTRLDYAARGEERLFDSIRPFLGGGSEPAPIAEVADLLALTAGNARVAVHRLRSRFRDKVRAQVAETVATPEEIDLEIQYLLSVLER